MPNSPSECSDMTPTSEDTQIDASYTPDQVWALIQLQIGQGCCVCFFGHQGKYYMRAT